MKGFILSLIILSLITACAPFPQTIMKEADLSLALSDVRKDPDLYKGKLVIWGGVIIETVNRRNETILNILQTELDYQKQPINLDKSLGRFMVRYNGFLDPYVFSKGREITIAGVISGKEEQAIGEIHYVYPVIDAKDIRLWEKEQKIMYYDPWLWWPPPYGWRYQYPWWW